MNTPATPSPMNVKKTIDHLKKIQNDRDKELDTLIEDLTAKVFRHETTISEERQLEIADKAMSMRAKRKRVSDLKKKGLSNKEISEIMRLPESTIRNLLKPFEPKPHLTQRIEGLEAVRSELSKNAHPAGHGRKRSGGK